MGRERQSSRSQPGPTEHRHEVRSESLLRLPALTAARCLAGFPVRSARISLSSPPRKPPATSAWPSLTKRCASFLLCCFAANECHVSAVAVALALCPRAVQPRPAPTKPLTWTLPAAGAAALAPYPYSFFKPGDVRCLPYARDEVRPVAHRAMLLRASILLCCCMLCLAFSRHLTCVRRLVQHGTVTHVLDVKFYRESVCAVPLCVALWRVPSVIHR